MNKSIMYIVLSVNIFVVLQAQIVHRIKDTDTKNIESKYRNEDSPINTIGSCNQIVAPQAPIEAESIALSSEDQQKLEKAKLLHPIEALEFIVEEKKKNGAVPRWAKDYFYPLFKHDIGFGGLAHYYFMNIEEPELVAFVGPMIEEIEKDEKAQGVSSYSSSDFKNDSPWPMAQP